jgi:hypothetical protein
MGKSPGDDKQNIVEVSKKEIDTKKMEVKDVSPGALRELLEKNLKWSQIIYEQNRKINNKLLWNTILGWLRLLIILIPLLLALWFLPPLLNKYQELLNGRITSDKILSPANVDKILDVLPVEQSKKEQIKAILK